MPGPPPIELARIRVTDDPDVALGVAADPLGQEPWPDGGEKPDPDCDNRKDRQRRGSDLPRYQRIDRSGEPNAREDPHQEPEPISACSRAGTADREPIPPDENARRRGRGADQGRR